MLSAKQPNQTKPNQTKPMTTTEYTFNLGSISHATIQPIDVAIAIHREIDYANAYCDAGIEIPDPFDGFDGFDCDDDYWDSPDATEYVFAELFELMQDHAPAYAYFGAHEGDGADLGFWVDFDDVMECVEQHGEPGDGFEGEWLDVSDHGNATLYFRSDGNDREIWSIV